MESLLELIRNYVHQTETLGGSGPTKEDLAKQLKSISQSNEKYVLICVCMLVALFLVSIVLIVVCRGQPEYLAAVAAFTGVSVFGTVNKMRCLWREKLAVEIVLAMAAYYPEGEFRIFIRGFFDSVFRLSRKKHAKTKMLF